MLVGIDWRKRLTSGERSRGLRSWGFLGFLCYLRQENLGGPLRPAVDSAEPPKQGVSPSPRSTNRPWASGCRRKLEHLGPITCMPFGSKRNCGRGTQWGPGSFACRKIDGDTNDFLRRKKNNAAGFLRQSSKAYSGFDNMSSTGMWQPEVPTSVVGQCEKMNGQKDKK